MQLNADDVKESIALPGEDWEPLEERLYNALSNSATVLRGHLANYVRKTTSRTEKSVLEGSTYQHA